MVLIVSKNNPATATLFQKSVPRPTTKHGKICNYGGGDALYSFSSYETTGDNSNRRKAQCQRGVEGGWPHAVDG
jgi:hypothetical protein